MSAPYYRFAQDARGFTYRISRNGDVWRALLLGDGRVVWNPIDGEYAEAMREKISREMSSTEPAGSPAPGGARTELKPRSRP